MIFCAIIKGYPQSTGIGENIATNRGSVHFKEDSIMAKNLKQRNIDYKGVRYTGFLKAGKVHVRVKRTACGQNLLVGVFDPLGGLWHNDSLLPDFVKQEVEAIYG